MFPGLAGKHLQQRQPGPNAKLSAPTTIAPTGTISIIAGASSGVEPHYAMAYVRNVMDQTKLFEINPYLEAVAKSEGFYSTEFMEQVALTGSLSQLDVPQWVKDTFRVTPEIEPEWHVRMQAAFQASTDNSVSKTINFPSSATLQDIDNAYKLAYETGCNGITVYRDGSKDQQVLSTGTTPQLAPVQSELDLPLIARHLRERPRQVSGITERVRTGHGNLYVTTNFDEDDNPFELFTQLGKAGGCDSAQLEAISRLTSMALRAGIPAQDIIDQLKGITCCPNWDEGVQIKSAPDAVAVSLQRQLDHKNQHSRNFDQAQFQNNQQKDLFRTQETNGNQVGISTVKRCPDCNGNTVHHEGCVSCQDPNCGWNRCE